MEAIYLQKLVIAYISILAEALKYTNLRSFPFKICHKFIVYHIEYF